MKDYWQKNILENHFLVALIIAFSALVLWELKSILISLFIAYILMATLSPFVNFLVSHKVPRGLAVATVFICLILIITAIILPIIPFTISQTSSLIISFPYYLEKIGGYDWAALINSEFSLIGKNVVSLTARAFSGFFSVITIIVVGFYLLLYQHKFQRPVILAINEKLGAWARGQFLLCLCIALASFLGLTILGIPFALPLAIIAGLLEIIPIIGPIVSAIPAVIIALTISPNLALTVVSLYILVQMLENNLLVPKIMQAAVGLNPVIVIVGIMVGGNLLGIMGAILSIPIILASSELLRYFRSN